MLRLLFVFGTRPEAIKMAPLLLYLRECPEAEATVCVTAQHRQMLDQVLDWFEIKPVYDLDLMQPDQSLASLTARALKSVSEVIAEVKPDAVLVQGILRRQ
jgi:UDP-N-acetylglucosamine 2-epimerase (non-hydrolysing)